MSSSKRPSTSSLRRFITSRPYVPVAEIRRRFGLDEPDCICGITRDGTLAYVGLPEREALKLQDLWSRDEIGVELSVEVRAPVVVGVYPMRIARYVMDGNGFHGNGHGAPNGHPGNGQYADRGHPNGNGNGLHQAVPASEPAESAGAARSADADRR
jgi:hypothetical protein